MYVNGELAGTQNGGVIMFYKPVIKDVLVGLIAQSLQNRCVAC